MRSQIFKKSTCSGHFLISVKSPAHFQMVSYVIVKCELFQTAKNSFMAAILIFSKTLKKLPAHLHIVGNVIVNLNNFRL